MPAMKRRRFLQTALTASATPAFAVEALPVMQPIVDTHQHLWDPALINPPWLQGAPAKIQGKHYLAEYAAATAGLKVTAIYMEIDAAPADLDREAEQVIALCGDKSSGTVAATIGWPDSPGFADYVKRHLPSGKVRGGAPGSSRRRHAGGTFACVRSSSRGSGFWGNRACTSIFACGPRNCPTA